MDTDKPWLFSQGAQIAGHGYWQSIMPGHGHRPAMALFCTAKMPIIKKKTHTGAVHAAGAAASCKTIEIATGIWQCITAETHCHYAVNVAGSTGNPLSAGKIA